LGEGDGSVEEGAEVLNERHLLKLTDHVRRNLDVLQLQLLSTPGKNTRSHADVTCGVTERGQTATRLVNDVLDIKELTTTSKVSTKQVLPAELVLEGIAKVNVSMLERERSWEGTEAQDKGITWSRSPTVGFLK
jgi:hypothetical protein